MHEMDYMNHVALYNDKLEWQISENGYVNLTIENKGIYNKIAQKLFRKPRYTNIELDCYGSRLWLYIDGKSTVYDIFMQFYCIYITTKCFNKTDEVKARLFLARLKIFHILLNQPNRSFLT